MQGKYLRSGQAALLHIAFVCAIFCLPRAAEAQRTIPITGDRLSGFVLPVEPLEANIEITALRGSAWSVDDTRRLLLEGDVLIKIGSYQFDAEHAALWINRIPSEDGLINQIAMYLDRIQSPSGRSGLAVMGEDVLITGSAIGDVTLETALLDRERGTSDPLVRRGEAALADYLKRTFLDTQELHIRPDVLAPPKPKPFQPVPGGTVEPEQLELPEEIIVPEQSPMLPNLFEPQGTVRVGAGRIELTTGEDENVVTATGGLIVEYIGSDPDAKWSRLSLTADRAVIFLDPGTLEELSRRQFEASQVRGLYLEGNVVAMADEGRYIIRAPMVYYDFTTGQAIMLNSILRTYSRILNEPVYARAEEMRQLAANQWQANKVIASTSEFYTPHFSLGADEVVVTQRPVAGDSGEDELYVDSRGNTVRAENVPFVFFPRFSGTLKQSPLRRARVGTAENDGVRIETAWDFFALSGTPKPEGVDALLKLDGFTKRGAAIGLEIDYDVANAYGKVDLYGMVDNGVDRTSSGQDVDRDGTELRGVALWEHQIQLDPNWSVQTQASYISDETFITTWREEDFETRREYETSFYVKHQEKNAALTLLAKYEINDFISNSYLLASRQYAVEKLPEIAYRRFGDSLWSDRLTYSSEYRYTNMRLAFVEYTPEELGVRGRAFGIDDDVKLSDALEARGLDEGFVNRVDTRHELAMPFQSGIFKIVPFLVGRFTGYDNDFDNFSSDADRYRMFGAAGVRITTQFQHIDNNAENRLFDIHRLRHIIEPNMTVWGGYSTVDQSDLPIYDEEVESIGDGLAVKFGLRNVWQTQRGGPGYERSVDFLTFDNDVIINSGEVDRESPAPQFFDYRPEYSQFGDHWRSRLVWMLSDQYLLQGESIYDIEESELARFSIGAEIRHSPVFRSYVEYRYIAIDDNELLAVTWQYELTPKYHVYFRPQWDLEEQDFRDFTVRVTRRFPDFDLQLQVKHDEIRNDTTVGASIDVSSF